MNFTGYPLPLSTDDHSTANNHAPADSLGGAHDTSSCETQSLFGSLGHISAVDGSTSVLIIIVAVIMTEKLFHGLHILTHDTPFQDMVSAIEKELMVAGCMAFIFKITVNTTTSIEGGYLHALEYAGEKCF